MASTITRLGHAAPDVGRGREGDGEVDRMGGERRMCQRKVEMAPNGHPPFSPQSRRRSQRKSCLFLGQQLAAAEPHPAPPS